MPLKPSGILRSFLERRSKIRNGRKNKILEYRKSVKSVKGGISVWKLFERKFPELTIENWHSSGINSWNEFDNIRRDWIRNITNQHVAGFTGMGNAPSCYRYELNRLYRSRSKQEIREIEKDPELWDDFSLNRPYKNLNWLYW